MQAMLTGRMIRAGAARGMGLVDKLVRHRDQLRWEGRKAVLSKRKSKEAGFLKRVMAMGPLRDYVADKMRKEVQKKARKEHYPAPYELIHLFERHGNDPPEMSEGEIDAFVPLLASPTATNLRRVFFLSEGLKKQGLRGNEKPVFQRVHVVGAGRHGRRYRRLVRLPRHVGDAPGSRHGAHQAGARHVPSRSSKRDSANPTKWLRPLRD